MAQKCAYGQVVITDQHVRNWFSKFRSGDACPVGSFSAEGKNRPNVCPGYDNDMDPCDG